MNDNRYIERDFKAGDEAYYRESGMIVRVKICSIYRKVLNDLDYIVVDLECLENIRCPSFIIPTKVGETWTSDIIIETEYCGDAWSLSKGE